VIIEGTKPARENIVNIPTFLHGVNLEYEWKMDEKLEEASRMFAAHRPTTKPKHSIAPRAVYSHAVR
jgi:hypothetical protein